MDGWGVDRRETRRHPQAQPSQAVPAMQGAAAAGEGRLLRWLACPSRQTCPQTRGRSAQQQEGGRRQRQRGEGRGMPGGGARCERRQTCTARCKDASVQGQGVPPAEQQAPTNRVDELHSSGPRPEEVSVSRVEALRTMHSTGREGARGERAVGGPPPAASQPPVPSPLFCCLCRLTAHDCGAASLFFPLATDSRKAGMSWK